MEKAEILELIKENGNKVNDIIIEIEKDFKLLQAVYEGIESSNKRIKNGSAKIFNILSQKHPNELYPRFDFFASLIESEDNIIKWNAIVVAGNLAFVDVENKIASILSVLFKLLSDETMITAAHAIESLGKIVKANPAFNQKISKQLILVETISRNEECRNILLA